MARADNDDGQGRTQPFRQFLEQLHDGEFLDDCAEDLTNLMDAIEDERTSDKGTLVLTFKFEKQKNGQIDVIPTAKVTMPKKAASRSVFYVDSYHCLTRKNPKQQDLPLRAVMGKAGGSE